MNLPNKLEIVHFIFHMNDIIRQNIEKFKDILSLMIKGTLIKEQYNVLILVVVFLITIRRIIICLTKISFLLHNRSMVLNQQLNTLT